jgi:hypothetical protein
MDKIQELFDRLHLTPVAALGNRTWRCLDRQGADLVLKMGRAASQVNYDFLGKIAHLYTPFLFPQPVGFEADNFLIYPYLSGNLLSEGDFESQEKRVAVQDLAGRLTAMFSSLRLAPMYQSLKSRQLERELAVADEKGPPTYPSLGLEAPPDGLAQRRWESAQSYQWTQDLLKVRIPRLISCGDLTPIPGEQFARKVEQTISLHQPPSGINLAHTAFTPEHILLCPDGRFGIIGWQVEPRPYNYMRLKYLAWSFIHSTQADILSRYRNNLAELPTICSPAVSALGFVLCLLEIWPESNDLLPHRAEKLAALAALMEASLLDETTGSEFTAHGHAQ